jgi:hypothetical protein
MLIALNIVLAAIVMVAMVALLVQAIRSEHRHHQLQAEASHRGAVANRAAQRRANHRHAGGGRPTPAWRRDSKFSPSRG